MSESNNPLDWAQYAEEDLIMAKSAIKRAKPLTSSACYHSQQCAEKYLKAILIFKNLEYPKTHDLMMLDKLCNEAGVFTGFTKENMGRLSGYAVHTRYPGNQPTPEEAKEAVELATEVRKFARKFLGLK